MTSTTDLICLIQKKRRKDYDSWEVFKNTVQEVSQQVLDLKKHRGRNGSGMMSGSSLSKEELQEAYQHLILEMQKS